MQTDCPDCEGKGCAICEHMGKRYVDDNLRSAFWNGFWIGFTKANLILSPLWIIVFIMVIKDIV